MNYEKKYKEALERARKLYEQGTITESLNHVFPELKESEDWIPKEIIKYLKEKGDFRSCWIAWLEKQGDANKEYWRGYREGKKEILDKYSELEKQGEQKPVSKLKPKFRIGDVIEVKPMKCQDKIFTGKNNKIIDITEESYILDDGKAYSIELQNGWKLSEQKSDEVEPKFKPGDWISGYYTNYKVLSLNNDGYVVEDVDGDKINILFENEKFHHLFTIADAKDGDVLCYKDEISLYKHNIKNCTKQESTFGGFVYHCCYDGKRFITDSLYSLTEKDKKDIYPATKEQRDTLERAMADAGYTFNFESKELKELSQSEVTKMSDQEEVVEIPFGAKDSELQEATYYIPKGFHAEIDDDKVVIKKGEKPTAWSEEDEEYLRRAINATKDTYPMTAKWLKSLKQRIGG